MSPLERDLQPTEEELLTRATAGDRQALTELLFRHFQPLAGYVRKKLAENGCGPVEADDVVQQTFVKAFRSLDTFHSQGPGSFGRWLRTIADHVRIDELRKQQRRRETTTEGTSPSTARLVDLLACPKETPSRAAMRRELDRALRTGLATLQPRQREAVALVYLEELTLEEAAHVMGTSKPAVHSLVYRGLQRLREVLGGLSGYLGRR